MESQSKLTDQSAARKLGAKDLIDLTTVRKTLIPRRPDGRPVDPSTVWRWNRKGLEGLDGERIKLEFIYVGNRPYVTANRKGH